MRKCGAVDIASDRSSVGKGNDVYMKPPFYTLIRVHVRGPNRGYTWISICVINTRIYRLHTSRIRAKSCRKAKTRRRVYKYPFVLFYMSSRTREKEHDELDERRFSPVDSLTPWWRSRYSRACRKLYIKERLLFNIIVCSYTSRG